MGFFSFFSKDKKETLDKGLSKTKESVFGKIARAVAGKSKVDDEVLDNNIGCRRGNDIEYYSTYRETRCVREIYECARIEHHFAR